MATIGKKTARKIVKLAAGSLSSNNLREWLRTDSEGSWELLARESFYKAQDAGYSAAESITVAANFLACCALDAALGSCQASPGIAAKGAIR